MPQSLSCVYVHIVFSTKHRKPLITKQILPSLCDIIGGICKTNKCQPVQIGGHKDHVHILCRLSPVITQAKLVQEIKRKSSKWMKPQGPEFQNFYWQDGYFCGSVRSETLDVLIRYIRNQERHHQKISFKNELRRILKSSNVPYDERYIWG